MNKVGPSWLPVHPPAYFLPVPLLLPQQPFPSLLPQLLWLWQQSFPSEDANWWCSNLQSIQSTEIFNFRQETNVGGAAQAITALPGAS